MAGESAGRSARRMRDKADRLSRAAERWERGAEGERRTALALAALPSSEWTVLHDLPWPGRPRANIDHIAVGPPGVFVIDSKNWSGTVGVRDGVLLQNGRRRDAVATAARDSTAAVRGLLLAIPSVPVRGVLAFVRDEETVGRIDDTLLCSTANIATMLRTRPPVLDRELRNLIVSRLNAGLTQSPTTAVGNLTTGDRMAIWRTNRERSGSVRSSGRRRKSGVVPSLVGASLAIGFFGIVTTQPQVLDGISDVLVGFMTDDLGPDRPADEPAKEPKDQQRKDKPTQERRSE